MATITIQIPDKFKTIALDNNQVKKITSYFIEDYLTELNQDNITKQQLENNLYDIELNNKLKKALWI